MFLNSLEFSIDPKVRYTDAFLESVTKISSFFKIYTKLSVSLMSSKPIINVYFYLVLRLMHIAYKLQLCFTGKCKLSYR